MSSSGHRVALFHVASVMVESLLYQSQVGVIYSVTPCLVGCVRKDCVLGSAGKTKPAALSPLSLSVSINQPLFSPPALLPPYSPCFFSSSLSLFQWVIKQIIKKKSLQKYSSCVYSLWRLYTQSAHTHRSQDMRKWLWEAVMGGPYVQPLYISRLALSTLPDHHNLVCLQHKVWSKLGWVH